jgi:arylsulfatase A-like enzyme
VNKPSPYRVLANGTSARLIRERFGAWQRSIGDRPFFAFINFFDAHAPYGAPAPYDTMFLGRRPTFYDIDDWRQRDSTELYELRTGYQQAIAWLDSQVGSLIADLRQRGVLDRTLIVVTADHGEDFGEHGYSGHGASLHSTQLRVPLVIVPPGWREPKQVSDDVSLRDLAATVVHITGLADAAMPGNSLTRYWRQGDIAGSEASPVLAEVTKAPRIKSWYPSSGGAMRSIVDGRMNYVVQVGGREWLFDLNRDPLELHNLAELPAYQDSLVRMRAALVRARGGDDASLRADIRR